ncbi:hypothetical protein MSPP1_003226 [Malassezia sp. CBS 17886]|nr:hypothetical protein MSPP1_003226 [Malassezia sp. CBS 17886]
MRIGWLLAAGVVGGGSARAAGTEASPLPGLDMIPTNISNSCYTLLSQLNSDKVFQQCTEPLIAATNLYTEQGAADAQNGSLTDALDGLCARGHGCDRPLVRQYIAQFWHECAEDLESGNDAVMQLYDYLYVFNPFHDALCSRESRSGDFCLHTLAPSIHAAVQSQITELELQRRGAADWAGAVNGTYVRAAVDAASADASDAAARQVFLFLHGASNRDTLCSECTQLVLSAYIRAESATPYALGLARSPILHAQQAIYGNASRVCGAGFVAAINKQAGVQLFADAAAASSATGVRPTMRGVLGVFGAAVALLVVGGG